MEISPQLLQKQNPWWFREELILEDEKLKELEQETYRYSSPILEQFPFDTDAILTLKGPRQVGKSTCLKLIIKELLLVKRIPRQQIFYFSLDRIEDFNQLYELIECYLRDIRPVNSERLYLFLDEISFVREWQRGIKALADEGRLTNVTMLLTGSNLVDVSKGAERLPGRRGKLDKVDYELLPLTFREFMHLVEPQIKPDSLESLNHYSDQLRIRFREYLLTGGFPIAINLFYSNKQISSYVYQLYLSWIEGDMGRHGKQERNLYQIISRLLAHQSTAVSWLNISREAGIASHGTIQEYVEILEKMFVLYTLPFIDLASKAPKYRKNKKIYIRDPLIFHCFNGKNSGIGDNFFSESQRHINDILCESKLVESVVGAHLLRQYGNCYFWQGKQEIDFLVKIDNELHFYEVKYQENVKASEFNWFTKISPSQHRLNVITKHHSEETELVRLISVPNFLMQLKC